MKASAVFLLIAACHSGPDGEPGRPGAVSAGVFERMDGRELLYGGPQCGFGCDMPCTYPQRYVCIAACGFCLPIHDSKNATICSKYATRSFVQCGASHTCPPNTVYQDALHLPECRIDNNPSVENNAVKCVPVTTECLPKWNPVEPDPLR